MHDGFEGHRATFGRLGSAPQYAVSEIRLKKTIEVRSCDAQPMDTLLAVPALWTGIGYDDTALELADRLTRSLSYYEVQSARPSSCARGCKRRLLGVPIREWSEDILTIAEDGLRRRARHNATG